MSRGRKLLPAMEFSTAGMSTRSRTFSPRAMIRWASASAVAAPPMSFFMLSMPLSGLMSSPPVSKHTPLPTSVTRGWLASPHVMSSSRGAAAASAARPTAWISGKFLRNRSPPTMALNAAPWRAASLRAASSSCAGPMSFAGVLMRSRASVTASTMMFQFVAIELLRQIEPDVARFGFAIARETVSAERKCQRRQPRVVRLVGEAIDAVRQKLRQAAGKKQVPYGFVRGLDAEQNAAEAIVARQQQMPPGFRLETGAPSQRRAPSASSRVAHRRIGFGRDEPDRNRVGGSGSGENRSHRDWRVRLTASRSFSHTARAPWRPRARSSDRPRRRP